MSRTYKTGNTKHKCYRTPRHAGWLREYKYDRATGLFTMRRPPYEIMEGAYADLRFSRYYSKRAERGRKKVKRLEVIRRARKKSVVEQFVY